jgi:hypothetical protein
MRISMRLFRYFKGFAVGLVLVSASLGVHREERLSIAGNSTTVSTIADSGRDG